MILCLHLKLAGEGGTVPMSLMMMTVMASLVTPAMGHITRIRQGLGSSDDDVIGCGIRIF
jgi:hypothetical protein